MPPPEKVIVDTYAFYALVSLNDSFHEQASETYERLLDREQELWTTSYVLVETIALVHRRLGFELIETFLASIESALQIIWIESELHKAAWESLQSAQGRGLSFVDWTVTLASKSLDAPVFTFDRGFALQNIAIIPE